MIYVYFFIKCVVRWSENSVRFEKSYGNWLSDGPNSVRFSLTVWDMACMVQFRYHAAKLWNSLPEYTRKVTSFNNFNNLSRPGMVHPVNVPYANILNKIYNATHKWLDFYMNMWCRTIYWNLMLNVLKLKHRIFKRHSSSYWPNVGVGEKFKNFNLLASAWDPKSRFEQSD